MKNPIVVLVIIAVIAGTGYVAYTLSQNSSQADSMMKKDEIMMPKEETTMEPKDEMLKKNESVMESDASTDSEQGKMKDVKMSDARYVQYSKSALESASNNRRVLFFYASWCPTCKPADANFTQNVNQIPNDVTLIRVNYNDPETDQEEKDLAKKYGITYQHTFVQIDNMGTEVTKWNGGKIDELLSNIK